MGEYETPLSEQLKKTLKFSGDSVCEKAAEHIEFLEGELGEYGSCVESLQDDNAHLRGQLDKELEASRCLESSHAELLEAAKALMSLPSMHTFDQTIDVSSAVKKLQEAIIRAEAAS